MSGTAVNMPAAPLVVDRVRSAAEIAERLQRLLDPTGDGRAEPHRPLQQALLRIVARHAEILTQHLNAAPGLHLAAFNECLTGTPRPAAPAYTVLTFRAAPGAGPVVVPMHTQVAAAPQGDDPAPIVFETTDDLELVRAAAVQAWSVDAGHRRQANVAALWSPAGRDAAVDPLAAASPVPRACHLGHLGAFGLAGLREVRLRFQLDTAAAGQGRGLPLDVGIATPQGFQPLALRSDTTAQLTQDGEWVFDAPPVWPVTVVAGTPSRWLTLRPAPGVPDGSAPPRIRAVALQALAATAPTAAEACCTNGASLDTSKDFFPLGERPRFGDVFELHAPAFDTPGAHIELRVQMTNPQGADGTPIPPVSREGKPSIVWEMSTAEGFRALAAADGTRSLTADGALTFTVPPDVAATTIAGRTGAWLRARLAAGHYGSTQATDGTKLMLPRAPAIRTVTVASSLALGPLAPECIVREGALLCVAGPAGPFDLFVTPDVDGAALYLGFAPDGNDRPFAAGRTLNLHLRAATPPPGASMAAPRWQQFTAAGWRDVAVAADTSAALRRSGIVRLRLAGDSAPWSGHLLDTAVPLAWLRLVWPPGSDAAAALPLGLALNAVAAVQSQRLRDEPLGSSNGRGSQRFMALRTPIVGDVQLQVRESTADWIDWQPVDDLGTSHADARHFMLDRGSGSIVFGDGRQGRIPPAGAGNLRLHAYAVGGGRRGNLPAGSVVLLRSALPSVDTVSQPVAAAGGLDAEGPAEMQAHASAWLRHRDRAIGADDHADLALTASPEVARAWCITGRDLAATPPVRETDEEPGVVSLVVMPHSSDPQPRPGPALLDLVAAHLAARRAPVGRLVVVGPTYAAVSVTLRFTPRPDASGHAVGAEIAARIARFLHPLDGGADGRGWAPSKRPHRSDLVALAGAVPGVDVVRSVKLQVEAVAFPAAIVAAGPVDVAVGER